MQHFMIDGARGYRSRLNDVQLVQEVIEELPHKLGLEPAMPAFLLPYYNGVDPDDCGVSAFVFLRGGHFTLHTFSVREAYFADLVAATPYDAKHLRLLLDAAFPCDTATVNTVSRTPGALRSIAPDTEADFGPHVFLDIEGYTGPQRMDDLFELFDTLPYEINMTPIMRPYTVKGTDVQGRRVISTLTMIAESHISLHVYPDEGRAYFDLFSCQFFDMDRVMPRLRAAFPGEIVNEALVGRGSKYKQLRTERAEEVARAQHWLHAVTPVRG